MIAVSGDETLRSTLSSTPTAAVATRSFTHRDACNLYEDTFAGTFYLPQSQPRKIQHAHSNTLASSTRGGLDVYMRESAYPHYSCFNELDEEVAFDAKLGFSLEKTLLDEEESMGDEGFFETVQRGDGSDSVNLVRNHKTSSCG